MYIRVDSAVAELLDRFGGLPPPADAHAIWDDIWVRDAHHSTAIEGNTLVRHQVEELLHEGRAVGSKLLAEYMEVKGYADAARWVYGQALEPGHEPPRQILTLTEVRHAHHLAMSPVWDIEPHPHANVAEAPGSFREHDIAPFPGGMSPPSHPLVPARMRDWLDDVQAVTTDDGRHLMERLARIHAAFERVHPFLDGNGRTGRLLLNLVLCRLGYPPVVVARRDRDRYLKALRQADAGSPGILSEMIARGVLDNLYRFVVPAVAEPASLVPLAALASDEVSTVALRTAAIRGRLKAVHSEDGQWRSNRLWVDEYLASRHQRLAS
ncbi:Fic family protein [Frankia sp. Cr1]|uniref:Fic family protein n=1 Tax=Frankia sp. Cr1 TaxID=3073931 RepID=UPI002AD29005|nr:Fic family protein [Frankia sp. Cr1]